MFKFVLLWIILAVFAASVAVCSYGGVYCFRSWFAVAAFPLYVFLCILLMVRYRNLFFRLAMMIVFVVAVFHFSSHGLYVLENRLNFSSFYHILASDNFDDQYAISDVRNCGEPINAYNTFLGYTQGDDVLVKLNELKADAFFNNIVSGAREYWGGAFLSLVDGAILCWAILVDNRRRRSTFFPNGESKPFYPYPLM